MSTKAKLFVIVAASLGSAYIALSAVNLHVAEPSRFYTYLVMAILCSLFQARRSGSSITFALNLPFLLLSIVDLSRAEAVAVGCAAALAQGLWNRELRSKPSQILLNVAALATVIASADFAYDSLLSKTLPSVTVRLFFAAIAFFVANTLPAAMAIRFSRKERLGQIWKDSYLWSFPYYLVAAAMAGIFHAERNALSLDMVLLALPIVWVAYRHHRMQKVQLEQQQKHVNEVAALHLRAIEGLALAVESKDMLNTKGHLRRVQVFSLAVGKEIGLTGDELEALRAAALLHDIGKLAVPEQILTKPGKLTPDEFAKMKVHPVVGAEIVEQVRFPYPVAPIVRAHHEKWDGSGYPYGLKGEEIPIGARILTAVDCLDALSSDREYRLGLPFQEAMKRIREESGTSFDPKVIKVLDEHSAELELLARESAVSQPSLSTNIVIHKGHSPDAGLDLSGVSTQGTDGIDFLSTIAAIRRHESSLLKLSEALNGSLTLQETLSQVDENLVQIIPHQAMVVLLRRANSLVAKYAGGSNDHILSYLEVPVGKGLVGWVAEHSTPVVNGNPTVDPGFACEPDQPLRSALAAPLDGPNGTLGVIVLYSEAKDAFTRDHLRMLTSAMPRIGLAVETSLKNREQEEYANLDAVTGFPNAYMVGQLMEAEVARARRVSGSLAVVFCSIEGLPQAFRELGTGFGDDLLKSVAEMMKQDCRDGDLIGRLGNKEFVLILPGMTRPSLDAKLHRLAEIASSAAPVSHPLSFRIGESFYPDDGEGSRHLLDVARHRALGTRPEIDLVNATTRVR